MKFIFPKNYNFSFKFMGLFSYLSIFVNLIWARSGLSFGVVFI